MSVKWAYEVPLKVLGLIKNNMPQQIKEEYNITDLNYSTVGSSGTPAVFPFIYVKVLPNTEIGRTFDNVISGIEFGIQVEVIDNKKQQNARVVMIEIAEILTKFGFVSSEFGFYEKTEDTHRLTSRFERVIGQGDTQL